MRRWARSSGRGGAAGSTSSRCGPPCRRSSSWCSSPTGPAPAPAPSSTASGCARCSTVSVTYHRWVHTLRSRARWRRADHATIYLAIAGTYTAISLAVVRGPLGVVALVLVWSLGATGAALKISGSRHGDTFGTALYLALGWTGVVALPGLLLAAEIWPASLLFIGGMCYTIGAVWFAKRWPRLRPSVFSYHEVWHVCTLLATIAHFTAIWVLTT